MIFSNYYITLSFINTIPKLQNKNNIKNSILNFTFYKSWKSATLPQDELNNYLWDMARLHHGRKHRGTRIAHLMFK